jgi:hypothetical protein
MALTADEEKRMKITGLRVLIFERRPDPHNETAEYVVH